MIQLADQAASSSDEATIWAAAMTCFVTVAAVFVASKINKHQQAKKHLNDQLQLTRAISYELTFYFGKLQILQGHCVEAIKSINHTVPRFMPCYTMYPSYLEELRLELARQAPSAETLKVLGNCHFELSFIQSRLAHAQSIYLQCVAVNGGQGCVTLGILFESEIGGLSQLVLQNLELFQKSAKTFEEEAKRLAHTLDIYDASHPFPAWD